MANAARQGLCTWDDLLTIPEGKRHHEVIDGLIVEMPSFTGQHADAQSWLAATLKPRFARNRGGGDAPGGWWIYTEVNLELERHQVYRPDLVGWRRERVPERPIGTPIRIRPDWVCEVLSPSNTSNDTVLKMRGYFRAQVPRYWLVDPMAETLTVCRWTSDGYTLALTAQRGERIRAEPFDAIEFPLGLLFGDEPEDE